MNNALSNGYFNKIYLNICKNSMKKMAKFPIYNIWYVTLSLMFCSKKVLESRKVVQLFLTSLMVMYSEYIIGSFHAK